jgi:branched-chain amino acid transport system permease protein
MVFLLALVVDGVLAGAVYALIALAFVVVYKASRTANFALGEWLMVGAGAVGVARHGLGLGLLGAAAVGGAASIVLALLFSRIVLRRLVGRPLISLVMVTIGLGILLRGASAIVFAGLPARMPLPLAVEPLVVLGIPLATEKLTTAAVAAVSIAAVAWFFGHSRTGTALRALADDEQAAMTVGIDVNGHLALAWALMALLALMAGSLWTVVSGGGFGLVLVGLKVFPIVIVGGLDSIPGSIVGAVLIGVLESLTAGYVDPLVGGGFASVASYLVLLAVLFVRPHGLFGEPIIERV